MSTQLSIAAADRPLTAEQDEAIARRCGSLLLAAGAGSGKTSVLVERFVGAVREDGVAPGKILAITFTERAAGELRERLRARFLQLAERRAAAELEGAFVCTFHGFCVRLLRAHPLNAGLDPGFAILDEGLASHLRVKAFAGALRGFLADGGQPALELLAAYGAQRLQSMMLDVYAELRSRGQLQPVLPTARPPACGAERLVALRLALEAAWTELQGAYELRPGVRLEQALTALTAARSLLEDAEQLSVRSLERLKLPGAGNGALAGESASAYRQALSEYTQARADELGASACQALGGLLKRFAAGYEQLKRTRGMLDFDDLELHARDLLAADERVRGAWSERFQLLMVDEFQDSNPRQLEILAALERDNLCTVGDEFQSIYGFRHADVGLMRARRRRLTERNAVLTLAHNFRGCAELLDITNALFSIRFGDDYTPLSAGRDPAGDEHQEPLLELLLTDKCGWDQDGERGSELLADGTGASQRWRLAEARLLAQRIAELIDAGQAKPAEVVVLLRGLGDVDVYERALQQHGLATIAAVGGFWADQQVEDLLAYLRALCNPLDEPSLYGVLASPLARLSSDGLALIARAARLAKVSVWEMISDPAGELHGQLSATDAHSLRRFSRRFAQERRGVRGRPLAQLIERAVAAAGYGAELLCLRGGPRRLANVHKLTRIARQFEASEGRDLRAFLDHVEHLRNAGEAAEPDAPVADENLDAVRLMSIHTAKGLEFPVVCVADLGRGVNPRAPDLLVGGEGTGEQRLGLQLVGLDGAPATPTLDFAQLRAERLRREAQEEERIIYVAMTRARERLLLSGAADFASWPEQKPGAPAISWLAPALIEDLPGRLGGGQAVWESPVPDADGARVRCWLNTQANVAELHRPPAGGLSAGEPIPAASFAPAAAPQPAAQAANEAVFAGQRSLSYSSLRQFERCGYSYYLRHVLGLPEDHDAVPAHAANDGIQGRSRGLVVHRLLESIDFKRFTSPSLADVQRAAHELDISLSESECERLAAFVGSIAGSPLSRRLAAAVRLGREQPFAFSIEGIAPIFTGVLDTVAREQDGGWLVVDYKSDNLDRGEDLERLVQREYALQRLLYGLAALRAGASRVHVVHWFLERPEEWVEACYAETQTDALQAELARHVASMQASGYAVSDRPHRELCQGCPGRRGLCSWGEERTLAEGPEDRLSVPVVSPDG